MSNNSEIKRPKVGGSLGRRIPKRNVLVALAAFAALDVGLWLFAVRPLGGRRAERAGQVAALTQQVTQKRAAIEKLRAAVADVDASLEVGDDLLENLTFERRTTYSNLLTELGAAAKQAGVEMRETSYAAGEVAGNETFGIVSINAAFRGQYENLVKLLNLLDRSERFLIVERLGAAPREEGGLAITMRIDAFVRGL